jgi:Na+-translocating ferredoxin:NAD+ oxidoreductase RnfG subunit
MPVKNYLPILAIIVLIMVLVLAQRANVMNQEYVHAFYKEMLPEAASFTPVTDRVAKAENEDGELLAYVGVSSAVGYGGPILVGAIIKPDGSLEQPLVLSHKETSVFLRKLDAADYFKQYIGKRTDDSFTLGYDLDAVSGATLSSGAIQTSVQIVAHAVATDLGLSPKQAELPLSVGVEEITAALLFAVSLFMSRWKKAAKLRLLMLLVSVVVLGFWLNRSFSIAQIMAGFMGFFPSAAQNLLWYIVVIGALLPVISIGKNLYCLYVCPFCGLQEGAHQLSRINLPLGRLLPVVRNLRQVLLFVALLIGFLTLNPSYASYEPFGTVFGVNGASYNWYLLFVALVAGFFFRRFWCFAFCPVGAFLDLIAGWRRTLERRFKNRNLKMGNGESKSRKPEKTETGKAKPSLSQIIFVLCYCLMLLLIALVIWEKIPPSGLSAFSLPV